MKTEQQTREWAAKEFGIKPEEVLWYNSGSCYDRIGVLTKEAADLVTQKVNGQYANGGMLDGMPLGGQIQYERDGVTYWNVTC